MQHEQALPLNVVEYSGMFDRLGNNGKTAWGWEEVERKLQVEGEWTRDGAVHMAALARRYGAFMLRNALALAIVLEVEDGDLAF